MKKISNKVKELNERNACRKYYRADRDFLYKGCCFITQVEMTVFAINRLRQQIF